MPTSQKNSESILPQSIAHLLQHKAYKLQWKWRPNTGTPWPNHWSSTVAIPDKHNAEQALRLKQKFAGNGEYMYQIVECIWEEAYAHMPFLEHPDKIKLRKSAPSY